MTVRGYMENKSYYIWVRVISDEFSFRKFVPLQVSDLGEGYIEVGMEIAGQSVEISGIGKDIQAAQKDFAENIAFLWQEYAAEDDARLTDDAKQLKCWMLQNVVYHPVSALSSNQKV